MDTRKSKSLSLKIAYRSIRLHIPPGSCKLGGLAE